MRAQTVLSDPDRGHQACAAACLQAPHDAAAAGRARACLADPAFDWAGFLRYIRRERVSPLIHAALGEWDILPPGPAERIRKDYLHTIWINDRRLADLRLVLQQMAAAGVPVTLLKGAALICTLYEKRGLRPMTDIDLLVPPEHFERAERVLQSCGYEPWQAPIASPHGQKEVGYRKPGRENSAVDLHQALFSPPHQLTAQQTAWFWQDRPHAIYDGLEIWTLNPTAQILHICAHLWFGHSDEGDNLLRRNDLDLLIRRHAVEIDWEMLLSIAADFELLLPLQKTLPDLAADWHSPMPEGFCGKLAALVPTTRERRKFGMHYHDGQNYLKTMLGFTLSHPEWRGRLRYARTFIFPPWQYIMWRYQLRSPLLVPYFYAHRLVSRAIQQVGRLL